MKHQHIQIQRSYPGIGQRNLCVESMPKMWFLLKDDSGICFDAKSNNENTYIRPWCYITQLQ